MTPARHAREAASGLQPVVNPTTIARALETHGLLKLALEIAVRHHVTIAELLGTRHSRPEARARRELWSRAYEVVRSYTKLGALFGRNQTSVRTAILKHRCELSRDECGPVVLAGKSSGCARARHVRPDVPCPPDAASCEPSLSELEDPC